LARRRSGCRRGYDWTVVTLLSFTRTRRTEGQHGRKPFIRRPFLSSRGRMSSYLLHRPQPRLTSFETTFQPLKMRNTFATLNDSTVAARRALRSQHGRGRCFRAIIRLRWLPRGRAGLQSAPLSAPEYRVQAAFVYRRNDRLGKPLGGGSVKCAQTSPCAAIRASEPRTLACRKRLHRPCRYRRRRRRPHTHVLAENAVRKRCESVTGVRMMEDTEYAMS